MDMAYGNELRQKLLGAADLHQFSQVQLAEIFGVSLSWVKRVIQRRRETGSSQLLPFAGGKRPKLSEQQDEQVRQYVLADTDTTLREVQRWLETTHTIRLSLPTLSRLLAKLDLPRKKSPYTRPSATEPRINRSEKSGASR
jgi:transposase